MCSRAGHARAGELWEPGADRLPIGLAGERPRDALERGAGEERRVDRADGVGLGPYDVALAVVAKRARAVRHEALLRALTGLGALALALVLGLVLGDGDADARDGAVAGAPQVQLHAVGLHDLAQAVLGEVDPLAELVGLARESIQVPDVDAVHQAVVHVVEQRQVPFALLVFAPVGG